MKPNFYYSTFILALAFNTLATISSAQTIAGGAFNSIVICNDNTARTWGGNANGQLGVGTTSNSNIPLQVNSISGVIAVATGGWEHSAALKNDGTVWSWGLNNVGQLGNNTTTDSNVPVQVSSISGVTSITNGRRHSLAIKNDGTLWVWGSNFYGQFGNGNNTSSSIPVQISSLTGVVAIAAGEFHTIVLKNDGTVWAFGYNVSGQLGNNTTVDSNTPVQVSSLTGVTAISAGRRHSLALKNDGTVWAWGFNSSGQLGNGNNTDSNVPVQVSSLTNITSVAGGEVHSLALKNDGTVWSWGSNANGQLGNGTNTLSVNLPVPVSSLTAVSAIAGGGQFSLALKNNSTVWAWGLNTMGQLGTGNNLSTNVPVQTNSLCSVFTSLNEDPQSLLNSVSIFPNPFSSETTLKTNTSFNNVTLTIYNALGKEVKKINHISGTEVKIEKGDLTTGIYFIDLTSNSKRITTKKLIIH